MGMGLMDWPVPIGIFERLRLKKNGPAGSAPSQRYLPMAMFGVILETLSRCRWLYGQPGSNTPPHIGTVTFKNKMVLG